MDGRESAWYFSMNESTKLVALRKEIDAIHLANRLYWDQKKHSQAASAEYEQRQERLEQIRREMEELMEDLNT